MQSLASILCVAVFVAALNGAVPAQAQISCKTVEVGQVNFGSEPRAKWGATSARHTLTVPGSDHLSTACGASIWEGDTSSFTLSYKSHRVGGLLRCSYSATFAPVSLGTQTAEFGFRPPGRGLPCGTIQVLKLIGTGVPAALHLKPTIIDFGHAVPQTDGVFKQTNLVNSTVVGIDVGVISSNNPDFMPAQNCAASAIDPHSSCAFSIAFKPSVLGKESGQISIAGDQQGSPQVINVSGIGVSSLGRKGPPPCQNGLCGKVRSGYSKAIAKSAVTLYALGNAYGTGASALASAMTDAKGDFALASFICPSADSETYVVALGGDAGAGNNSAIGLIAALGPCGQLATAGQIVINELTTISTEWALAQFIGTTGQNIGAPLSNSVGLRIGLGSFANLADIGGRASAFLTSSPCGTSSSLTNNQTLTRLDALANIFASCVQSNGPASRTCGKLFADSGASSSETTLAIAHAMASNPKNNVADIFQVSIQSSNLPFQPTLTTAPDGCELALNFSPSLAALNFPRGLALDAAGNVWAANGNNNSVSELPAGDYSCGASNFAPAGAEFHSPFQVAFDNDGNVWVANFYASDSISELPAGNLVAGAVNFNVANTAGAVFDFLDQITLDVAGNVWMAAGIGRVSELPAGNYRSGATNFNFGGSASKLAFDPFGNLWVTNNDGVSELSNGNYSQATSHPLKTGFYPFLGLATDAAGDVWVITFTGVSELPAGNYDAGQVNYAPVEFDCGVDGKGPNCPDAIAIDGGGAVWLTGDASLNVVELPATNYDAALSYPIPGTSIDNLSSVAIDAAGNVWVTNLVSSSISELVGLAKPVMTPLQACLSFETNNPGQPCVP
jgi:streptogramin lyase